MSAIADALESVRGRMAAAALAAGREPESVRLIAVSKLQPVEAIREAYAAGQRDFGENYVQELQSKAAALADLPELRWHLIGHLQRNKARHVAPLAHMVHSIDSVALVAELGRRVEAVGRPALPVLVEVNLSGEASKSGCEPAEVGAILEAIGAQSALIASGLMTVPPIAADPREVRPYFEQLAELRRAHASAQLVELSMGMTADLEVAVACGATLVRVGTAIFGSRQRHAP